MKDSEYMELALMLAKNGLGWTAPNPMVGAVLVKDGEIIGQGWHEKCGEPHAERNALANCKKSPQGATLYVTLEPCCHQGRPAALCGCHSGCRYSARGGRLSRPNPLVAGKGIRILREHGIEVTEHMLEKECDRLNEVFFHYIQTKRPFVVMKYAMTMDGKIATYTGASKWITSETARAHVQEQRHKYTAIMVGVGTVLADNPMLNCRMEGGKNPIRIICDTHLRTPLDTQIVATAKEIPTILATCCADRKKQEAYLAAGCQILQVNEKNGHVDLQELMQKLGEREIDSILIEGGGTLHWTALEEGIVQKVQAYIAPKLFGGRTAKTPIEGAGRCNAGGGILFKEQQNHSSGRGFSDRERGEQRCSRELLRKSEGLRESSTDSILRS